MKTLKARLELAMAGPPEMTQAELARACGLAKPTVTNWLGGRTKNLKGPSLVAASKALGVNPEWLETGRGPMRGHSPTLSQSMTLDRPTLAAAFDLIRTLYELHGEKFNPGVDPEMLDEAYEIEAKRRLGLPVNLSDFGKKYREKLASKG